MLVLASLQMFMIIGISGLGIKLMGPIINVQPQDFAMPSSTLTNLTSFDNISTDGTGSNVTAIDLSLADEYGFYLFRYSSIVDKKTTWHTLAFDYVNKINVDNVTIDGVENETPKAFRDLKSSFRNKVRFAQMVYMAAVFNALFVLVCGILGWVGYPQKAFIHYMLNAVTLLTMVIFAVLITLAMIPAASSLDKLKPFGVENDKGTSIIAIAWFAAIHMVIVAVMWLLMAIGKTPMNPAVKQKVTDSDSFAHMRSPSDQDIEMNGGTTKFPNTREYSNQSHS